MAVDEYLLIFNEKEFTEFNEIANEFGLETQFMRDMIPSFYIDKSKCETEGNCYVLDMPRIDYCMLLAKLKALKPRSHLVRRINELGFTQDAEFRQYFESLERDLKRYNLTLPGYH